MLEVLVVLVILSLVGTVTALGLPNARDRVRLTQVGAWLDSMLADLRGQARREGRMRWVEFDMEARRYRVSDAAWRALPPDVALSFEHRRPATGSTPVIAFLPDGTGSEVVITMQAGAYSSVRHIGWLTGLIRRANH